MAGPERNPVLVAALEGLSSAGFAAEVWDRDWLLFDVTDDYRQMISLGQGIPDVGVGLHFLEPRMEDIRETWPAGPTRRGMTAWFSRRGGAMAGASPGGIEAIREAVGEHHLPMIDSLEVVPMPAAMPDAMEIHVGTSTITNDTLMMPLHDEDGTFVGAVNIVKPAVGAAILAMLAIGDKRLFQRMLSLVVPAQRPGAIMFGDLESSTSLARRLPSAVYFELIRSLSRGVDQIIVDAGGVVGKHVGDGVTAFFLSETHGGSDSEAARACIEAARAIQATIPAIAAESGLDVDDVTFRFGLHWGASLYVGRLLTSGRLEVTALGDEVNEGARIEPCAVGGLRLASKPLIERLDAEAADSLGLDPAKLTYVPLADLDGTTEKASRDAPNISVCPV